MELADAISALAVTSEASVQEIEEAYWKRITVLRLSLKRAKTATKRREYEDDILQVKEARSLLLRRLEGSPVSPTPPTPIPTGTLSQDTQADSRQSGGPVSPVDHDQLTSLKARDRSSEELRAGEIFAGRFKLRSELNRSVMGVVWLAQNRRLDRPVVLKFLPDLISRDPVTLAELKQETKQIIELTHPNIARVYDFVEDGTRVAISMEYIYGSTLSQLRLIKRNQIFEVDDLKSWVRELCGALEHAHKQANLILGDVKPDNLMVDGAGHFKIADFGIARRISDRMTRFGSAHEAIGIPIHSSPQQALGMKLKVTDDTYALGATLYHLLTSTPPFYTGEILTQVNQKIPPSMTERRAELGIQGVVIPESWEKTVAACLSKGPAQRPQSAIEVAQNLSLAPAPTPPPPPPTPPIQLPVEPVKPVSAGESAIANFFGLVRGHPVIATIGSIVSIGSVIGLIVLGVNWSANPLRPKPTPAPSVAGDQQEQELKDQITLLVRKFLAEGTNIPPPSFCDKEVLYNGIAVKRELLEAHLETYSKMWPERSYTLISGPFVDHAETQALYFVKYEIASLVRNRERALQVQGRVAYQLTIQFQNARPVITSISEKILEQNSSQ